MGLLIRGLMLTGTVVAAGALLGPSLWRNGRPFAKTVVKSGMEAAEAAKTAAARFVEDFEDLVAEVKHELRQEEEAASEAAEPKQDE